MTKKPAIPPRPNTPPPLTATRPAATTGRRSNKKTGSGSNGKTNGKAPFIRLLPVLILVAALMLSFRINDLRYFFAGESNITLGANSLQAQQPADRSQTLNEAAPNPATSATTTEAVTPATNGNAGAMPPIPGGTGDMSQSEKDLLNRLQERRLALDARESALDRREALLKAGEDQIERKVTEMKTLQSTIQGLLRQYNEQEDTKMRSLVKIYENMKPKDAARIFEQLDMAILLEVVERMKEQKVAPILAEMDPSKARLLTSELAQRRQIPLPKGDVSG